MEEIKSKAPRAAEGSALRELADDPSSRKRFLKMVGGTGAAGAFGLFLAACGSDEETTTSGGGSTGTSPTGGAASKGDLEILNYALTLEFLESEFYRQAIDSGEIKDQAIADVAKTFGEHEQEHVDALTATIEQLGGTPTEAPETDFSKALKSADTILSTAAMVENVGAAAYLGAAPEIKSPEVLAAALSIHSVEGRHAAALNQVAGNSFQGGDPVVGSIPDGPFAEPMDMESVLKAVQPFLAKS